MVWDESKHPRDSLGRFTDAHGAYRQNTSYREILEAQGDDTAYFEEEDPYSDYPTIYLPKREYAMVMHELATNLTDEEYKMPVVTKNIRNYAYV